MEWMPFVISPDLPVFLLNLMLLLRSVWKALVLVLVSQDATELAVMLALLVETWHEEKLKE